MSLGVWFLLNYLVGAVVVALAWRLTAGRRLITRCVLRSLALALMLAPGLAVGQGLGIVPLLLLPRYSTGIGYLVLYGLFPLLVTWALLFLVLLAVGVRRGGGKDLSGR